MIAGSGARYALSRHYLDVGPNKLLRAAASMVFATVAHPSCIAHVVSAFEATPFDVAPFHRGYPNTQSWWCLVPQLL